MKHTLPNPNTAPSCGAFFYTVLSILFLVLMSGSSAFAGHFKGGQITYNSLGEGRYEFLITGYWQKGDETSITPYYGGRRRIHGLPVTVSQTLLADGETVELVQKQEVSWTTPGLYLVYWKTCCRDEGANFDNNDLGMVAYVNYDPELPSSSPKMLNTYDPTNFKFEVGQKLEFKINIDDAEDHEQEYSMEIPYGLGTDANKALLETGFQVKQDGTMLWENPIEGTWAVNIRLSEKIDGNFTGAYVEKEYKIKIGCSEIATNYSIIAPPCVGSENGKISLSATGGVAPFSYSLDEGITFQSQAEFEHLAAGDYTAIVIGANGCSSEPLQIVLEEVPLPEVSLSQPSAVCANSQAVALSGGNPEGGTYQGSGVVDNYFHPQEAGVGTHLIYYTYTDSNGCSSTAQNEIVVNESPLADAGPDAVVYRARSGDDSNGNNGNGNGNGKSGNGNGNNGGNENGAKKCTTLTASATAGTGPYHYAWSTGEDTEAIDVCPVETTTYTLTVTDAAGCSDISQVTVTVEDVKKDQDKKSNERSIASSTAETIVARDLSLETSMTSKGVAVFPNPVTNSSKVMVRLEEADFITIDIIDLSGRVVQKLYTGNIAANQVLSFPLDRKLGKQHLYIGRLSTSQGVQSFRLMMQ